MGLVSGELEDFYDSDLEQLSVLCGLAGSTSDRLSLKQCGSSLPGSLATPCAVIMTFTQGLFS